jgi:hypothetical protein
MYIADCKCVVDVHLYPKIVGAGRKLKKREKNEQEKKKKSENKKKSVIVVNLYQRRVGIRLTVKSECQILQR